VRVSLAFALLLASCSWYEAPEPSPTPPPVIGGTMIVTAGGNFAVASDPARNIVVTMDIATRQIVSTVALEPTDEPGRLVEDGAGRIHVALRRAGAIATLFDGQVVSRRAACPEPRGIVWQASTDQLHVACEGGELITFPAGGGAAVRNVRVERDLRDVVIVNDHLVVTTFRNAEVLSLDAQGRVLHRVKPTGVVRSAFTEFGEFQEKEARPIVGYRAIPMPSGEILLVHQRSTGGPLSISPGGYGQSDCGDGPVESTVSFLPTDFSGPVRLPTDPDEKPAPMRRLARGVVPVDIAQSPDGGWFAVVLSGSRTVRLIGRTTLAIGEFEDPCGFEPTDMDIAADHEAYGLPVSAAFTPSGALVVQWDNAMTVESLGTPGLTNGYVVLPEPYTVDPGRILFNKPTSSGLACASCHPEAREDTMVWDFGSFGRRRTQNIRGHLAERAPYHWGGDMVNLRMLTEEVMVSRMGGEQPDAEGMFALTHWLGELRPIDPAPPVDIAAVDRGRVVFEEAACATCHNGPLFTNNALVNVGTGGNFKVPTLLGVGARAPYLHDGCAPTLRDRFGPCGGGDLHGVTSTLSAAEMGDLIAFLESL